jgi:uncharacterized coiled-coil protein SlyX
MKIVNSQSLRIATGAIFVVLACVAVSPLANAAPQSQQQSVADAARRARQQKKTEVKQDRVWDNDTLPATGGGVNTIGPGSPDTAPGNVAATSSPRTPSASSSANSPQAIEKQRIEATAEMNALKDQLLEAQKVLEVSQRAFALDSDTYYSKTNFAEDKAGKARLDAMQANIVAQQAAIAALKAKLAALEDKLRALPATSARQETAPATRQETTPPARPETPLPPRSQPVPPVRIPD